MITYDLSGRTALVTGSSRGIGKAMADALEDAGAKVIRTSSRDCDLSDRKAVYAFVERVKKENQVDILVNNAGTILRRPAAMSALKRAVTEELHCSAQSREGNHKDGTAYHSGILAFSCRLASIVETASSKSISG